MFQLFYFLSAFLSLIYLIKIYDKFFKFKAKLNMHKTQKTFYTLGGSRANNSVLIRESKQS